MSETSGLTGSGAGLRASPGKRAGGRGAGLALVAVGAALVGWAAWQMLEPRPAPYTIAPAEAAEALLTDVDLALPEGTEAAGYEVRVDRIDGPVAQFVALTRDGAPEGVLAWSNLTSAAVLSLDVDPAEVAAVAAAIREHAPADAVLIGLGDAVGRLSALTGLPSLVTTQGVDPVIVPDIWRDRADAAASAAAEFWTGPGASGEMTVMDVAEALLGDEVTGSARLAAVAGDRPALLVLKVTDLIRLGALAPDRFGIAYRDFPSTGDVHGVVKDVKRWAQEHGHDGYAVQTLGPDVVRAYFLLDPASNGTLVAQALPFTTSNPAQLGGVSLVYQHGGTWIYRVRPLAPAASDW